MIERQIDIETVDGRMETFICRPERDGPHPVVIFYMDAWGIREELRDMVRRYATAGYYLMLPNLYYRSGIFEPGPLPHWDGSGEPPFHPVNAANAALTIEAVMNDTEALLRFIDGDPAAASGPLGVVGYCMSGRFAINAAARFADRVAAASSMYGTQLVTDREDSPHRVALHAKGELYFGSAEKDHWAPPAMIEALDQSLAKGSVSYEIEIYPEADHAFGFPERPTYHKPSAERHWERMFALFDRRLRARDTTERP